MPETTPSLGPAEAYTPPTTPLPTGEPTRDPRGMAIRTSPTLVEASRLLLEGHQLLLESKTAEAAPLLLRALDLYERQTEIPADCVQVLGDLASIATTRGDLAAAESLLQRALALAHVRLGPDHPDVATVLGGLARVYLRRSEFTKAEPLLQRLLEIKRARGEEHPEVATVLASLATVHSALGSHESAEAILRRVLAIREKALAPNHFATMTTLEHLAESCAARGKVDEALALLHRALAMRDRTLGGSHPSIAAARTRIADLQLLLSNEELGSVPVFTAITSGSPPLEFRAEEPADSPQALPEEPVPTSDASTVTLRDQLYDEKYDEWEDEFEEPPRGPSILHQLTSRAAPITAFARTPRGRVTVLAVGITSLLAALVLATRTRADVVDLPIRSSRVAPPSTPPATSRTDSDAGLKPSSSTQPAPALASSTETRRVEAARRSTIKNERASTRSASLEEGADNESKPIPVPNAPRLRALETGLDGATIAAPPGPVVSLDFAPLPNRRPPEAAAASSPVRPGADFVHAVMPAGNPSPEYPPELLRKRIEGRVVAEFLVDAKGRVDPRTFRVISSTDEQFTQSVRALLPNLRFLPAESGGMKTEEWVAMPFRFSLKAQ